MKASSLSKFPEHHHQTQRFKQNWHDIKTIRCKRQKQVGNGTSHKVKDERNLNHFLKDGWDTPLCVLEEYRMVYPNRLSKSDSNFSHL
jgi:hypothetical protein